MRESTLTLTAVAITVVTAAAVWASASIHSDAALKIFGEMATAEARQAAGATGDLDVYAMQEKIDVKALPVTKSATGVESDFAGEQAQ